MDATIVSMASVCVCVCVCGVCVCKQTYTYDKQLQTHMETHMDDRMNIYGCSGTDTIHTDTYTG